MTKLALSLLTTIIFAGIPAFASFSGLWSGRGQVSDISGSKLDCEQIKFNVEQTSSSLKILQGYILCKPQELRVKDMNMTINAGKLILEGKAIGTISDDTIRLSYINNDGIRVRSVARLKDEKKLLYQEEWLDNDGNRMLFFQGQLSRK